MSSLAGLRSGLFFALGLLGCEGSSGPVGGSAVADPLACVDPQPILFGGDVDSGYVRCADGAINRVAIVACADPLPAGKACSVEVGTCAVDADCTDRAFGRCIERINEGDDTQSICGCMYGCATEADCAGACICAGITEPDLGSRCAANDCGATLDCDGKACGLASSYECRFSFGLACRTDADTCGSRDDCEPKEGCGTELGPSFSCSNAPCAE